jgi:tRNA threonylcarbamoyl adenosine modification protein YeaZ
MTTLALELSSPQGSVALMMDERLVRQIQFANDRKNSGEFFAALQTIRREIQALDKVIIGLGPGSYAGVRIALAAGQGFAAAFCAEAAGIASLCGLECEADDYDVIGDARRGALFIACFRSRIISQDPKIIAPADLREYLKQSELPRFRCAEVPGFENVEVTYPSAAYLALRVKKEPATELPLEPIYLREPHITAPRSSRLLQ